MSSLNYTSLLESANRLKDAATQVNPETKAEAKMLCGQLVTYRDIAHDNLTNPAATKAQTRFAREAESKLNEMIPELIQKFELRNSSWKASACALAATTAAYLANKAVSVLKSKKESVLPKTNFPPSGSVTITIKGKNLYPVCPNNGTLAETALTVRNNPVIDLGSWGAKLAITTAATYAFTMAKDSILNIAHAALTAAGTTVAPYTTPMSNAFILVATPQNSPAMLPAALVASTVSSIAVVQGLYNASRVTTVPTQQEALNANIEKVLQDSERAIAQAKLVLEKSENAN